MHDSDVVWARLVNLGSVSTNKFVNNMWLYHMSVSAMVSEEDSGHDSLQLLCPHRLQPVTLPSAEEGL